MSSRILIIEDNIENLDLMIHILKNFGCNCLTSTDGKEGFEMAKKHLPDLILCDIQVPTMNGYEIAQRLKADKILCQIPIIAVTALAIVGDREKILSAGFDKYISKPIDIDLFFNEIKPYLYLRLV